MTKTEAIAAMQAGKIITHDYFSYDEWMTMQDGKIVLEDGVKCEPEDFWKWRTAKGWENGYSEWLHK
jgi:hypothetical protein